MEHLTKFKFCVLNLYAILCCATGNKLGLSFVEFGAWDCEHESSTLLQTVGVVLVAMMDPENCFGKDTLYAKEVRV